MAGTSEQVALKTCTKCGLSKPATPQEFGTHQSTSDRLGIYCRECDRVYHREKYAKNPRASRERQHLRNYGITLAERDLILKDQGGCCACCGTTTPGVRDWHTDHDHITGEVRGVLCHRCNVLLGGMGDSPDMIAIKCAQFLVYLGVKFNLELL